jgi:hypothetical protein
MFLRSTIASVLSVLTMLATLSSCQRPISVFGQCLSLVGRDPVKDAAQDFHNGERYLMTDINGGYSANVFVPGYEGENCHFIYGQNGKMLRVNKRPLQTLPSGDVLTAQEKTYLDQYHTYIGAYNREFARLDNRSYDRTCSAMTLHDAREQFGAIDESLSDLKK